MQEIEREFAVDVAGLAKRYGRTQAVADLDLQVRTGEVFALLGPNGAGKTTTVEILEGFRRADAGTVRVLGADPWAHSRAWLDRIGIVPQGLGSFDDLRVGEVVRHFASCYSRPLDPALVIDLVGLTAKTNDLCRSMSGGQRRRVDIALAIAGDPDLIFLDEPTTGLDPDARRQTWELIEMLADRGTTILLTTHYLDEAERLADRVGVVIGGTVVAVGHPSEVGRVSGEATTVRFDHWPGLELHHLPALPIDAGARVDGPHILIETALPTAATAALINWVYALGMTEIPGLAVNRPTLEETYLRMVHDHQTQAAEPVGATS